jgi:GcrA cell cycle regulator
MSDWDDHLIARFKALHRGGKRSFAEIADTLNREFGLKLTKNACIGKGRRLGLEKRPRSTPTQRRRQPKAATPTTPENTPELRPPPINPGWTIELPVLPAASGRITIYQLQAGVCHYPFGERPPYAYCGNTTRRGVPYCPHHEKVVYPRGTR